MGGVGSGGFELARIHGQADRDAEAGEWCPVEVDT